MELLHIPEMSLLGHWILGSVLIFIQVIIINRMMIRNRIMRDPSLVAGLGYLVLSSFFRDMNFISPDLLAMSFFIPAVSFLFDIYKKFRVELDMFNAGLLTGLAALMEPSFLFFTVIGMITLLKLRAFHLKEFLQYLNAVILPFFMVWGYCYLTDQIQLFFDFFQNAGWDGDKFSTFWNMGVFRWVILILGLAVTLFSYNSHMLKKSIQAQKKIEVVYWILIISLPVVLTGPYMTDHDFLIWFFPVGILLGMILHRTINRPLAELIHLVLFFGSFANHFYLWW